LQTIVQDTRKAASVGTVAIWVASAVSFYVLSVGPATRFETIGRRSDSVQWALRKFYAPLFMSAYSTGLQGLLQNYIFLWIPDQSLKIPQKNF